MSQPPVRKYAAVTIFWWSMLILILFSFFCELVAPRLGLYSPEPIDVRRPHLDIHNELVLIMRIGSLVQGCMINEKSHKECSLSSSFLVAEMIPKSNKTTQFGLGPCLVRPIETRVI